MTVVISALMLLGTFALGTWLFWSMHSWENELTRREAALEKKMGGPNVVRMDGFEPGAKVLLELAKDGRTWHVLEIDENDPFRDLEPIKLEVKDD